MPRRLSNLFLLLSDVSFSQEGGRIDFAYTSDRVGEQHNTLTGENPGEPILARRKEAPQRSKGPKEERAKRGFRRFPLTNRENASMDGFPAVRGKSSHCLSAVGQAPSAAALAINHLISTQKWYVSEILGGRQAGRARPGMCHRLRPVYPVLAYIVFALAPMSEGR